MILTFIIITVITCASQAQIIDGEDCGHQAIQSCRELLASSSKSVLPLNFNETCRLAQDGLACMIRKSGVCLGDGKLKSRYQAMSVTVNDKCSPQSKIRIAYEKHHQCIESIDKEYSRCRERQRDITARPDITDEEQNLARSCCGFKLMTDCMISVTKEKCGDDAATFPKEALKHDESSYEEQCRPYINAEGRGCQTDIFITTEPPGTPPGTSVNPKPKGNRGDSSIVSSALLVVTILPVFYWSQVC